MTDGEVVAVLINEEHVSRVTVRAAMTRAADERAKQAADQAGEGE